jgi:hypothetical protein
VLNPGQRGAAGRVGALLLGMLAWLAVWGGLAAGLSGWSAAPAERLASSSPAASLAPSPTPLPPTATPSPTPGFTRTSTPAPSPSPAGTTPAPPPSPLPSPAPPTPTRLADTPTPLPLPTPTPTPTATNLPPPTLAAALPPERAADLISAVEAANELLRASIVDPSLGNLATLETFWRDEALTRAQAFAQDFHEKYLRPLEVTFTYLEPPQAFEAGVPDAGTVVSTEQWIYWGPKESKSEAFVFTYTLNRLEQGWVITRYTFRNAPNPPIPAPGGEITAPLTSTTPLTDTAAISATVPITTP